MKPGNETYSITDTAQQFHQLEHNIIDGDKEIILNPNESQRKEMKKYEVETNEV